MEISMDISSHGFVATQSAPSAETPRINFSLPRRMAFRMDSLLASTPGRWVKGRLQCPCNTNVTGSEKKNLSQNICIVHIIILLSLLVLFLLLLSLSLIISGVISN